MSIFAKERTFETRLLAGIFLSVELVTTFKMSLEINHKAVYQAPEMEIVHLQSFQIVLQSPDQGGGGMPGGIPGENIF